MNINRMVNNKYKTNEMAVFLTLPLEKETITKNALIPKVLTRGTNNLKNQIEINKKLENMYGTNFNCGIDKTGDLCVLKFYIESISNKYVLNNEDLAKEELELLMDIIFNPLVENEAFNEKIVEQEKENLLKIIESKKDNKENYAFNRCVEEMFKDEPYGIYKYGNAEDIKDITAKNLYEYYLEMIKRCRIDVFINGMDAENVEIPENIKNIGNNEIYINDKNSSTNAGEPKEIKESLDVTQGKLIIGLDMPHDNKFAVTMYNMVLGGGANSKLFQNVREKESLAYSAGSIYIRRKNSIFIKTGIELKNYEKALSVIKEQIEEMKKGNITDDEIEAGRELVLATLRMIKESQEDTISFCFDQSLFKENLTIDEYLSNLEKITKEQIVEVANKVNINTIYFLENSQA